MLGPGQESKRPELWIPPGGTEMLEAIGSRLGRPDMFSSTFDQSEYPDRKPFEAAGFEVRADRVLHYDLLAFGFRVSADGTVVAYSGDSGPCDALAKLAEDADLFVCEATLLTPNPEGGTRGHLAATEAVEAFEASGAKRLLITHRPHERPLDPGLEQAYDGMELVVRHAPAVSSEVARARLSSG